MTWRDWYPNVQCAKCGEWVDYRTATTHSDSWREYSWLCDVCTVIRNLEGKSAFERLMTEPSFFEKKDVA